VKTSLFGLIGLTIIIIIWWYIYQRQKEGTYLVPSPINTFEKLYSLFLTGTIFRDLYETLYRMLAGYVLASIVGISFGLLLGSFSVFRKMFSGIIDFFRSIPVTSLYPVFVLGFGIGSESKIAMIFWASFFIICINTTYGVIQTNPIRRKMALLYGASPYQIFTKVTFFDALPNAMVGLRVAISYALIVSILTEMFMGSEFGIGAKITEAYNLYQIDTMFALIIVTGMLGYLLNLLFSQSEKKLVAWKFHAD
jgi:ABC-type nitrate/sulfonate/bicarbonate transport system permease component